MDADKRVSALASILLRLVRDLRYEHGASTVLFQAEEDLKEFLTPPATKPSSDDPLAWCTLCEEGYRSGALCCTCDAKSPRSES